MVVPEQNRAARADKALRVRLHAARDTRAVRMTQGRVSVTYGSSSHDFEPHYLTGDQDMRLSEHLERIATPILLACAVLVSVSVARREFFPRNQQSGPVVKEIKDWREYANGGSIVGPPLAPIVVVEFSDFQCPFCAVLSARLDSLQVKYPGQVAVVYRHAPIDNLHPLARPAARASICADRQGRFKAYHDHLFASQKTLGQTSWMQIAAEVGVEDTAAFSSCLTGDLPDDALKADSVAARKLDLRGTPLVLFNGRMISGAPSFHVLDSLSAVVLKKKQ